MSLLNLHIDNRRIILHALFWMIWVVSFTLIQSLGKPMHEYFVWLMYYLITLPVFVVHTYLIAYWLVPEFFFKQRYLRVVLGALVFLVIFSIVELVVSNYMVFANFDPDRMFAPGFLNLQNILISGLGNHYIILVFLSIKVGVSWYTAENNKEELQLSKTETELEIFSYQLQPRIILSMVECLEDAAGKREEKVPELIIQISGFLNRFLFEGREEMIPLKLDSELLEEYINIQQHIFGDRLQINFNVSGNLKPFVVPPLLLLPFLNDAIKMIHLCNNSFEMSVFIKTDRKYLLFSFTLWSEDSFRISDNDTIEITKRRLQYRFRGKHRIIENIDDNFKELSLEIYL